MPNVELDWSKIDKIITDSQLSYETKVLIEQNGVEVIVAK